MSRALWHLRKCVRTAMYWSIGCYTLMADRSRLACPRIWNPSGQSHCFEWEGPCCLLPKNINMLRCKHALFYHMNGHYHRVSWGNAKGYLWGRLKFLKALQHKTLHANLTRRQDSGHPDATKHQSKLRRRKQKVVGAGGGELEIVGPGKVTAWCN